MTVEMNNIQLYFLQYILVSFLMQSISKTPLMSLLALLWSAHNAIPVASTQTAHTHTLQHCHQHCPALHRQSCCCHWQPLEQQKTRIHE